MRVFIEEGFAEGARHSEKLRALLLSHGYETAASAWKADLIIAHSAGWCFLPKIRKEQRLVLLDPAFENGQSLFLRSCGRLLHDLAHFRLSMMRERIWNIWYFFQYFHRWRQLRGLIHRRSIAPLLIRSNTFVVGIQGSSWWDEHKVRDSGVKHVALSGDHDVFWSCPERIVPYITRS